MLNLTDFIEQYLKEKGIKLETHQKSMLKAITEGKMLYYRGTRGVGKSALADALVAYEEYKKGVNRNEQSV